MSRSQKSWQRLPDTPLRIDRSAPLAKRAALLAHLETGHNLASGRACTSYGVLAKSTGRYGVSRVFTGTESLDWNDSGPTASSDISFCCIFRPDNVSVGDKRIMGVGAGGASNGGFWLAFAFGGLGFVKPNVVGAYTVNVILTVNQDHFIALDYKHSTGAARFYSRNLHTGVVITETLTNTTAWATSDGIYEVGQHRGAAANSGATGKISLAMTHLYTRSLAETEMLAANPWQLLPSTRQPSAPIMNGFYSAPLSGTYGQFDPELNLQGWF